MLALGAAQLTGKTFLQQDRDVDDQVTAWEGATKYIYVRHVL